MFAWTPRADKSHDVQNELMAAVLRGGSAASQLHIKDRIAAQCDSLMPLS